jgi:hypothetical protein
VKKIALFVLWLGGTAAAIGVAWAGVAVVDNQVIDPAPAINVVGNPQAVTERQSTPTTSAPPAASFAVQSSSTTGGIGGTQPPTSAAPANQRPTTEASPTTQTPTTQAPTTQTPTTQTPTTQAATSETYALVGGTAAVSFSADGVVVLWATPNPGFTVKVESASPGLKVEFRADHHRSRVDVWWATGARHTIREEPT